VNSSGILYIADTDNQAIRKVDASGAISSFVSAGLNSPVGVAVDPTSSNIYVSDSGNYVIRQVTSLGVVSTFAGTLGTSGYSGSGGSPTLAKLGYPYGIAVDSAGDLFIADMYNSSVWEVSGGLISTVAGMPPPSGLLGGWRLSDICPPELSNGRRCRQ
jgi:DNA-binding beta-propeller fold protein YncE